MIFIPALEQLDITQDVWDHVTEMAEQRQIDDEVLLDVQHREIGRASCRARV